MKVTGIGWAGVLTEDFESSVRFFSEVLELSLAYRDQSKELAHFRFRSGQLMEIYGHGNRKRKEKYRWFKGPVSGFEVDEIQSSRQEMIARGARFITELESWEDDQWSLFLGPEEKLFEILQPARRPTGDFGNILRICQAAFLVEDVAGALKFFSQVMEMFPAEQDHENGMARYKLPTGQLFEILHSGVKAWDQGSSIRIGFEVGDMAKARREMETAGIELLTSAEDRENGRIQYQFCAPDGFTYELVSASKWK